MARERSRRGCVWPILGCGGALLVFFILVCALGGYAYRAWQRPPQGWIDTQARLAAMSQRDRQQLAIALENRITRELSFADQHVQAMRSGNASGGAETKTLRLTTDEINAWLTERFPGWASNQRAGLPDELRDYRYWVDNGMPVLAAHVQTPSYGQVVSVRLNPEVQPDGRMTAPIDEVRGGQLELPLGQVIEQVSGHMDTLKRQAQLQQALKIFEGEPFEPATTLRDGRRVRLTKLDVTPEHIELTLQIEPAPAR